MSDTDNIWGEVDIILSRWGLTEIPFSESATPLDQAQVREVFTGRTSELKEAIIHLRSRGRKRLLVHGWYGIGKTTFMLELLGVMRRNAKGTLASYISLPSEAKDLATFALVALARQMEDDEWAQHQLNQLGLRPRKRPVRTKESSKAGISVIGLEVEEETLPVNPPQFPTLSFEDLLGRALQKYTRVIIAIDDLDKQDPARVREILHGAQGLLKGGGSFILTGHPAGLTRDVLTQTLGLFDASIELHPLALSTSYEMLVKYLNSGRRPNDRRDRDDPRSVRPFTPETAQALCARSDGVPRYLNRLAGYVLAKAAQVQTDVVDSVVLQQGLEHADRMVRGQRGLTSEDYSVLDLVLNKGVLSDATATLEDLELVKAREFNEIMPILERLVQLDLLRRLPNERATEFGPSPMLLGKGERTVAT